MDDKFKINFEKKISNLSEAKHSDVGYVSKTFKAFDTFSGKENLTHTRCPECKGLFYKRNLSDHMTKDCRASILRLKKYEGKFLCGFCNTDFTNKLELC